MLPRCFCGKDIIMLRRSLFALSLIFITLLPAAAQDAEAGKLPATRAGQIVEAYLKAFNAGDEQMMRAFISTHVSEVALKRRSIDERIRIFKGMLENIKSLELQRVLKAANDEIVVVFRSGKGQWLEIGFAFETAPPHKFIGLRVEEVDPPADAVPPPATTATKDESDQTKIGEGEFVAMLEKHLDDLVKADGFSGVVLVARNGKPFFQKAYALASKEHNVANGLDTKFNLGSINKLFTQVAIWQLVEQGKLSLDDTLAKLLPDYPNRTAAQKITVRHLLTMTSGIGDIFGEKFEATPKDKLRELKDFIPLFANEPLAFEPGTRQRYSNGGYVLLGAIIEKLSGLSYYDYVREHIFKVAGMENTDSFEADSIVTNLASGYTRVGSPQGLRRNNFYTRPARGSSAGGGYSTAVDLLKFTIAVRNNKLRVPDFRNPETGAHATNATKDLNSTGFGMAGGAPGINAVVLFNPVTGFTTVVMSNYDAPVAETIGKQIRQWLTRIK